MLTPQDIENKIFKKAKLGGYEINDVEDFLETLIIDFENMHKENTEFRDKCENLQESVRYYKTLEQGIEQTMNNAKEEAEKMRENAMEEVLSLRETKEQEYKSKISEYELEIRKKEIELEEIKKQMQIYKIKVKSMLEAQLKILDDEE